MFFLAVLGGGLYATQVPGGVATLDANPSIELTVNKFGRVLSARACNPDAQFVLDDLELRNQSLQTAADEIVAAMQTDGYLSADTNSVLVTVEAGKGDARLRDRLAAAVESAQTDCGMDPAVLAQVLEWIRAGGYALPRVSARERRCLSGRSARRWRTSPARRWRCCRSTT
ncbi:MAG: hypothetical protein ACLU0Z_00400 [Oscillospiraceae bacterium]